MDVLEFKNRIKSGELAGWYIFSGEEDYLKKYYLKELKDVILADETFMPFNYASWDGDEVDFAAIKEAIKAPPMMSDYKLIEWKFANLDTMKEGEREALTELFEMKDDYPTSVFVIMTTSDGFDAGTIKKPSKLATRLSKGFDILNFPKSTDAQLLAWLKKHFEAEKISADAKTLNELLFRAGHSMDVLNSEVSKLCCFAAANGKNTVDSNDVAFITSPSVECDAFALSNAVTQKNAEMALFAMRDLKQRKVEPQVILAMLERAYSDLVSVALLIDEGRGASDVESIMKLHPFKAKLYINSAKRIGTARLTECLAELCKIDAASKSGGSSGYGPIEMFITKNLK